MPTLPLPPAAVAGPAAPQPGWPELLPHRGFLVAFARRRIADPALAEDLVHDVFEAVASGRARFGGQSALRSWLAGILKHKIADQFRRVAGHDSLDAGDGDGCGDGNGDDRAGADRLESPQPGPEEQTAQRQRLRRVLARLATLPEGLRRAVELRLLDDRPSAEVCATLAITENNLFVRLNRARRQLAA